MRLVLVETRTEEYNGKVYEWEEIFGEGWYNWGESSPDKSTLASPSPRTSRAAAQGAH